MTEGPRFHERIEHVNLLQHHFGKGAAEYAKTHYILSQCVLHCKAKNPHIGGLREAHAIGYRTEPRTCPFSPTMIPTMSTLLKCFEIRHS